MIELTEEQKILRDTVRRMAREKIAPLAADLDEKQAVPDEIHKLLQQYGLMGLKIPEEHGGVPADKFSVHVERAFK